MAPVVSDLDVVSVDVDLLVCVVEDGRRVRVARVARHVVCYHQNDLTVGNAKALDTAVDGQHVRHVPVVEPETRRIYQHRPVVRVTAPEKLTDAIATQIRRHA